ncbi:MAG: carbohydrate binding domain-containing protein, partial [Pirellulales bacterium]|nr:carbohydrate binding domain-containing protein [Pirellulales bacterium]
MFSKTRCLWPILAVVLFVSLSGDAAAAEPQRNARVANLFGNAGFEEGREEWQLDQGGKTVARFSVDDRDAGAGQRSAVLALDKVDSWGVQFGQRIEAPAVGKTYTFAVLAKSVKEPAAIRLEIERRADPYDRAAASSRFDLRPEAWREFHVTFKVEKAFPEGWFAYVSCQQSGAEFRLDMLRLYEGEYVPYQQVEKEEMAAIEVALFDTRVSSPTPLSGKAIAEGSRWIRVPEDSEQPFQGDAVVRNDRLALVLRRGAPRAELFSQGAGGFLPRAVLTPGGSQPDARIASLAVVENNPGEVVLDASFQSADGTQSGLRLAVALGQAFVRTEPLGKTPGLDVEAPCRFVVLPDFFADDIVVDATGLSVPTAEIPSENFLLHFLPNRDAIVMTVANNRGQDARVELSGEGPQRLIRRSGMQYGERGKIWVAMIQGEEIWRQQEVRTEDAGKILKMQWTAPFPAQWRVDWTLSDKLTSSWEMASELKSGEFLKPGWFGNPDTLPSDRRRWTTVLGTFPYPCWLDKAGQGHLQPLARALRFQGPALVYPINRVRQTPLSEFTVVDLVRATLGVGPCEYILDVEGQGATRKGRATCATRDTLKAIYAAKQQKQKRAEIERVLEEVVVFVKHIRGRIDDYVDFGRQMLAYLQQQRQSHPELAEFLAEMETSTKAIDSAFEQRKSQIQTPQYVVDLTDKFRRTLLDYDGGDALDRCTEITHAIVNVGGNQDELVGECRSAVKVLRQRAGLAMA